MCSKLILFVFVVIFVLFGQAESTKVCGGCQILANDLLNKIEANSTYEWLANELENICERLLSRDPILLAECKKIVVSVAEDIDNLGLMVGKGYSAYGLCTMIELCDYYCCILPYRPEQVHIASTGNPTEMVVNFVTGEAINPTVQYGLVNCHPAYGPIGDLFVYKPETCNFTNSVLGTSTTINVASWQGFLHTAVLTNLQPSTTYWYRVGDPFWDWSTHNFNFTTAPDYPLPADTVTRIVAFGDMGAEDASDVNLMRLTQLAQSGNVDMILHAGDIGYANGYENIWDDYMRKIEFFAAYVPYMTAVGNHEHFFNFTDFELRFSMPGTESGSGTNLYFSFNYGQAHIIAYSFEQDYGRAPDMHPGGSQYNWLEQDLIWASNPQNRTLQPWIILYGHRPFYCSNGGTSFVSCIVEASNYRSWIEPLIQQYSVDLVITAHLHDYERMYPVYNGTVTSTSYNSPTSAVYVAVGTGGNREGVSGDWPSRPPSWSAFHSDDIGFGYMEITNSSLAWDFYSSYSNQVIDSFTITK